MQFTAEELTDKLIRAFDKDRNVVDHRSVLEVITALEQVSITKAQLEQTRLGKWVNDFRKKTKDKDLAKRAKNLIQKWRDFINPATRNVGATVNGGNGEQHSSLPPHLRLGSKPSSPASGPPTPSSGKSCVSPSSGSSSQPGTPLSSLHSRLSPRLVPTHKPASPLVAPHRHSPNVPPGRPDQPPAPPQVTRPPTPSETLSKVNVANKRKRRGPAIEDTALKPAKCLSLSDNSTDGSQHRTNNGGHRPLPGSVVNGDVSHKSMAKSNASQCEAGRSRTTSPPSRHGAESKCETPAHQSLQERRNVNMRTDLLARMDSISSEPSGVSSPLVKTPKVKTTAQLLQDLHNSSGMRLSGSATITKIAMNQIEKEVDAPEPVVPPEAKPRFRRKPGTSAFVAPPPSTDKSLSRTKTEMVQKFLQSSVPNNGTHESPPDPSPPTKLISLIQADEERVDTLAEQEAASRAPPAPPTPPVVPEIDPWSLLPPLDLASVCLEEEPYEVPTPQPVGEADIDRIQTEHWPGVNGQLDHECTWQSWTQTYSVPNQDDQLFHLLPYVCLDD